jgi:hypothetical protein
MPGTLDSVVASAVDSVKADVEAAVKAHPQYEQIVAALAEKAVTQLVALVA